MGGEGKGNERRRARTLSAVSASTRVCDISERTEPFVGGATSLRVMVSWNRFAPDAASAKAFAAALAATCLATSAPLPCGPPSSWPASSLLSGPSPASSSAASPSPMTSARMTRLPVASGGVPSSAALLTGGAFHSRMTSESGSKAFRLDTAASAHVVRDPGGTTVRVNVPTRSPEAGENMSSMPCLRYAPTKNSVIGDTPRTVTRSRAPA